MLVDNVNDSRYVRRVVTTVNNGQGAGQYTLRVAEGDSNPPIANVKS